MKCSKMAVVCLLGGITLSTTICHADGMVLVPGSDGSFIYQRQSTSFARHYGENGQPVIPESEREVSLPENSMALLGRSDNSVGLPGRVIGRPDVIDAIEQTAMRYGGHRALRKAGLTVNEWRLFFRANIEIESAYNPKAVSHVGAIGLGQLMPGTAAVLGVDPYDMHQNLDGSARYLLSLLDRFGTKELALAGYNAGPEAVSRHGGIPPYRETIGHVRKVMAIFNRLSGDML